MQTIRELKSYKASIVVDETRLETDIAGVVLMNMPWGGGGLMFAPQARYDDGMISVVIIKSVGRWELMRALPSSLLRQACQPSQCGDSAGKKVVIETEVPLIKSFDGDLHGMTPYAAEIVPQAVSVVVGSGR